jgi:hypothetical protein
MQAISHRCLSAPEALAAALTTELAFHQRFLS